MRFLLPTLICYIAAGTWALSQATARGSGWLKVTMVGVLLLLQFVWGGFGSPSSNWTQGTQKQALARVTDAIGEHVRQGDLVLTNNQVAQHLDFVRHWRLVDPTLLRGGTGRGGRMGGMRRGADPDAPMPRQAEKEEIRSERYRGLEGAERERAIAVDILAWAGKRRVYYVGSETEIEGLQGPCFNPACFKIIARVPLPEPPPDSGPSRRGFGMPGMGRFRPPDGAAGPDNMGPGGAPAPPGMDPPWRRGGRRGGFMGRRGSLMGEKELVIAEWMYHPLQDLDIEGI